MVAAVGGGKQVPPREGRESGRKGEAAMNPSMQLLEAARAEREAVAGEDEGESMSLRDVLDAVRVAVLRKISGPVAVAMPGDSANA
ncbi:hypothetical protein Uis1B_1981 [Bifidobacterium margollesii]|uniref:Uncharacterized protein n=1 Tax=Bifidobacterium margollesii TaxID=2020964 RepID=A0A2N5J7K7_9BIFI|nr:hypothetical protein [Bifidobacterium margollesii]PLS30190.1 hypothetical protein Uis1B_1981 [Bifidobacterium margollesii]